MTRQSVVLLLSAFVCTGAFAATKVDVTVGCCPLAIASKDAARYGGAQFGGAGMSSFKNKDGVISANDPVFNKLRMATVKIDGTATIENGQLVLEFPPGTDMKRLKIWVDQNGDGTMSQELAAKLDTTHPHEAAHVVQQRLRPGHYDPAPGSNIVRIPLVK